MSLSCKHGRYCSCESEESKVYGAKIGIAKAIKHIKKLLAAEMFYSAGPSPVERRSVLEEVIRELKTLQ